MAGDERAEPVAGAEGSGGAGGPGAAGERGQLAVGHDLTAGHGPEREGAVAVEPVVEVELARRRSRRARRRRTRRGARRSCLSAQPERASRASAAPTRAHDRRRARPPPRRTPAPRNGRASASRSDLEEQPPSQALFPRDLSVDRRGVAARRCLALARVARRARQSVRRIRRKKRVEPHGSLAPPIGFGRSRDCRRRRGPGHDRSGLSRGGCHRRRNRRGARGSAVG